VVRLVVDAATELTGAEHAAFVGLSVEPAPHAFDGLPPPETLVRLDDLSLHGGPRPVPAAGNGLSPLRSYLAVPVVSGDGEPLGSLYLGHSEPGAFTGAHESLLAAFAAPAGIAIEHAHRSAAAERDRRDAVRMTERLAHMQAVSARLAGARTVDEVAAVIVTGAAAAVGCARASLFVLSESGAALRLLDSFGYEGDRLGSWARIDTSVRLPTTDALRHRRLVLVGSEQEWGRQYPEVVDSPNRSVALAVIPLALGPHAFGVATFGWDEPRSFGDDEARFLEAVADQCAQALERARLYEVEREAARTLQQSLLPPRAPEIPGMEVAAVFRSGDRSVAVGGDFYDVFRAGPDRWGVAMGDVCGRGAHAAARTSLVRYTLRAVATGGVDDPVAVLRRVNDAVLAEPEADDRFCAAVFGYVEPDPGGGGASVTLACAGHPRPVVVRRDGWLDIRGQPGTLVGVLDELDVTVDHVALHPGDALVFYTDGVSESRNSEGEQFADEDMAQTLLEATGRTAAELAAAIRERAVTFSGGTLGDDLAVLVLRVPPDGAGGPGATSTSTAPAARTGRRAARPPVPARPLPPRSARLSLPSDATGARAARRFLAAVLSSWRMPEMIEGDAALLLSELATNAIVHARSPLAVIVRYDGAFLRVEVGDGSQAQPTLRLPSRPDAIGGRGLVLVDRMASAWGILPTARGKRVWFNLPVPPPVAL